MPIVDVEVVCAGAAEFEAVSARGIADARGAFEVRGITEAVARALRRDRESVHVQYAPAAVGRQDFGGTTVAPPGPRARRSSLRQR